ncbi:MAG: hypothetical protein V4534_09240 [Myxococcota bacterium]
MIRIVIFVVIAAAFLMFAHAAEMAIASAKIQMHVPANEVVTPPLWLASAFFFGNRLLASDFYMLRANLYVQTALAEGKSYQSVVSLYSLIRDLNPRSCLTYQTAGTFLEQYHLDEATRAANRFLEEGVRACPEDWFMKFLLAFNLSKQKDYAKAGWILIEAAKDKKAPEWVGSLGHKWVNQHDNASH